jgi:hypothetical protein
MGAAIKKVNLKGECMNITYRQLQDTIQNMTEEQKNCDVTVFDAEVDEYHPLGKIGFSDDGCDVLDKNHPVLVIKLYYS